MLMYGLGWLTDLGISDTYTLNGTLFGFGIPQLRRLADQEMGRKRPRRRRRVGYSLLFTVHGFP